LGYRGARPVRSPEQLPGCSAGHGRNFTNEEREHRIEAVYEPFKKTLAATLASRPEPPVLITVHSFTPVYFGKFRQVEVGVIHHKDDSLAKAIVRTGAAVSHLKFAVNEPYSQADGVAHTLEAHGAANGLINAMIEVRNDLIETPEQQKEIAEMLGGIIEASLSDMLQDLDSGVRS
jgi:predicted N-formylglutamate amidohydrolase